MGKVGDEPIRLNTLDQMFALKGSTFDPNTGNAPNVDQLKKGLLSGKSNSATYLLTHLKEDKDLSVTRDQHGHLTWKVGDQDIPIGSSWWDGFKHKFKMAVSKDYRNSALTETKAQKVINAYYRCWLSEIPDAPDVPVDDAKGHVENPEGGGIDLAAAAAAEQQRLATEKAAAAEQQRLATEKAQKINDLNQQILEKTTAREQATAAISTENEKLNIENEELNNKTPDQIAKTSAYTNAESNRSIFLKAHQAYMNSTVFFYENERQDVEKAKKAFVNFPFENEQSRFEKLLLLTQLSDKALLEKQKIDNEISQIKNSITSRINLITSYNEQISQLDSEINDLQAQLNLVTAPVVHAASGEGLLNPETQPNPMPLTNPVITNPSTVAAPTLEVLDTMHVKLSPEVMLKGQELGLTDNQLIFFSGLTPEQQVFYENLNPQQRTFYENLKTEQRQSYEKMSEKQKNCFEGLYSSELDFYAKLSDAEKNFYADIRQPTDVAKPCSAMADFFTMLIAGRSMSYKCNGNKFEVSLKEGGGILTLTKEKNVYNIHMPKEIIVTFDAKKKSWKIESNEKPPEQRPQDWKPSIMVVTPKLNINWHQTEFFIVDNGIKTTFNIDEQGNLGRKLGVSAINNTIRTEQQFREDALLSSKAWS